MWLLATIWDSTHTGGRRSCWSLTTDFLPWMITFFLIKRDHLYSPHQSFPKAASATVGKQVHYVTNAETKVVFLSN